MAVDTCLKNMEPPVAFRSYTQQPSPSRRGGFWPLILRVVTLRGCLASEKGRESEGKKEKNKKEREELKASRSKILLMKKIPLQCLV